MLRKRWRRRRKVSWHRIWLPAVTLAGLLLSWHGLQKLDELVAVYGENRCRNMVTQMLLDTALQAKSDEKLSCFTTVEETTVLQLNTEAARTYQAEVGKTIAQKLDALGEQTYRVPLGTVLESTLFMEQGPELPIRFVPVGSARSNISSQLLEAGVNQVLYRVVLTLTVDMTVLLPGGARQVSCAQELVLEETLLTGQVPMVYGG